MDSTERRAGGMPLWVKLLIGLAVLVPVCCVGSVLAMAIFAPAAINEALEEAQRDQVRAEFRALEAALDEFALENGGMYPGSLSELDVSSSRTLDPWNHEYQYFPPSLDRDRPLLRTLGADGKEGGEGFDADMDSESVFEDR